MYNGIHDDRNDLRLSVKRWMAGNGQESYRPGYIRRIVAETILCDRDPVDPLEDSWREGTFGAWLGVLDFARDEIARCDPGPPGRTRALVEHALSHLPHQPGKSVQRVREAIETLQGLAASSEGRSAGDAARAAEALRLAAELMGHAATKRTLNAH